MTVLDALDLDRLAGPTRASASTFVDAGVADSSRRSCPAAPASAPFHEVPKRIEDLMPTPEEIADVLEKAHDVLLVCGRSGDYIDAEGRVCVLNALCSAAMDFVTANDAFFTCERSRALREAATEHFVGTIGGGNVVSYNYNATDDEVFDALKQTAKRVREDASAV